MPGKKKRLVIACGRNGSKRALASDGFKKPAAIPRNGIYYDGYDLIGHKTHQALTVNRPAGAPIQRLGVKFMD